MARRYRLKDWDVGDIALNDPNAAWRNDPATERQFQRLKFFRVPHNRKLTKGQAADLLDALEPPIEELEDYDAWKAAGAPSIKQWFRSKRPSFLRRTMRLTLLAAFVLLVFGAYKSRRDNADRVASPQGTEKAVPPPTPQPPRFASVAVAQQEAMRLYPDLRVAGSKFNAEFVSRHQRYQRENPEFLKDTSWPILLAEETAKAIGTPAPSR
jgi:hypothetical protein